MKNNKILLICALALGLPSALSSLMHNVEPVVARAEVTSNPYRYTFTKQEIKSFGDSVLGEATWNITGDGGYFGYDTNNTAKGQQFGSSGSPCTSLVLSTNSFIDKKITSIKINTSGGSKISANFNVKIDDVIFGSTKPLIATATNYEFKSDVDSYITCTNSLSLNYTQTSKKAIYIKSIEINYLENSENTFIIKYDYNYEGSQSSTDKFTKGGDGVELPTPERFGYNFIGWFTNKEGSGEALKSPYTPTDNVTLYAKWEEKTKYTITFMMNDGTDTSYEEIKVIENEKISFPKISPTRKGYKFTGWYTSNEITSLVDKNLIITENLTLYAGWEESNYISDILTIEDLPYDKTSEKITYFNFTDISKDSTAKYSGSTAKNYEYDCIQTNDSYGIYSSKSGGYIRKVTINWNEKTKSGRIIDLYGSHTPFESYSNISKGTKINSDGIVYGKTNEVTILDNYEYIGIKSRSGAQYINSITFEWEPIKPTVDETILKSSYLFTEMMDKNTEIKNGIRFVGSVKEDKFANLSSVGFNFTLTSNDKNVTKDYVVETTKLYNKIDDSNSNNVVFVNKEEQVFEEKGYLSYSLILNNISETFNATITFYSYAIIDGVTYNSKTTTINIVNGAKA